MYAGTCFQHYCLQAVTVGLLFSRNGYESVSGNVMKLKPWHFLYKRKWNFQYFFSVDICAVFQQQFDAKEGRSLYCIWLLKWNFGGLDPCFLSGMTVFHKYKTAEELLTSFNLLKSYQVSETELCDVEMLKQRYPEVSRWTWKRWTELNENFKTIASTNYSKDLAKTYFETRLARAPKGSKDLKNRRRRRRIEDNRTTSGLERRSRTGLEYLWFRTTSGYHSYFWK